MIKKAQQNYFKMMIEENKKDYKAIFNIAHSLLFRKQDSPLPEICPLSVLAEDFSDFYEGKIDRSCWTWKQNVDHLPQINITTS